MALVIGLSSWASMPSTLQAQANQDRGADVIVDSSVLDLLGPPSNLPEMLLRQENPTPQAAKPVNPGKNPLLERPRHGRHQLSLGAETNPSALPPVHLHRIPHGKDAPLESRAKPAAPVKDAKLAKPAKPSPRPRATHENPVKPVRQESGSLTPTLTPTLSAAPIPAPDKPAAGAITSETLPPPAIKPAPKTNQPAKAAPLPEITAPAPVITPTKPPVPATQPATQVANQPATQVANQAAPQVAPTVVPVPAPTPAPSAAPVGIANPAPQADKGAPQALVALTAQTPASEPPASASGNEGLMSVGFDRESAKLGDNGRDILAHLASRMTEDATLEVQLLGYAGGDDDNNGKARRLSLSRALAVRSFLIDQGVRRTRIELRALGNKVPDGAPDRVDIAVQKRG